jgi:hypothetical protein
MNLLVRKGVQNFERPIELQANEYFSAVLVLLVPKHAHA